MKTSFTRSAPTTYFAHFLLWSGVTVCTFRVVSRYLPKSAFNSAPIGWLQRHTFGVKTDCGSVAFSLVGTAILGGSKPVPKVFTNHTLPPMTPVTLPVENEEEEKKPEPSGGGTGASPVTIINNEPSGDSLSDPSSIASVQNPSPPPAVVVEEVTVDVGSSSGASGPQTPNECIKELSLRCFPSETIKTVLPFSPHAQKIASGWVAWAKNRSLGPPPDWKNEQCQAALDQYADHLFRIAGCPPLPPGATDKKRMETLNRLYLQFGLGEDSDRAQILRDALRLLVGYQTEALSTELNTTSIHRIFKELLDRIPSTADYDTLTEQFFQFKKDLRADNLDSIEEVPEAYLQLHLAQQLAKAYYTQAQMRDEGLKTLNQVCAKQQGRDQFSEESPPSLAQTLADDRAAIEKGISGLSRVEVNFRKFFAEIGSDYFNPTSQGNIPERVWEEDFEIDSGTMTALYGSQKSDQGVVHQTTVQLRCPTPTKSTELVDSFKLFLDALYSDRERLMYCSLQKTTGKEGKRVELLQRLALHPRYHQVLLLLRFPMDGDFWTNRPQRQTVQALCEELGRELKAPEKRPVDLSASWGFVPETPKAGFYLPFDQIRRWYESAHGGELKWDTVVQASYQEVQKQYFPDETQPLDAQEQRAFILLTYGRLLRRLKPLLKIDYAIEGCKDDQDRGPTVKVVQAADNLVVLGPHRVKKPEECKGSSPFRPADCLNLRLLYHRAAWFNKSAAVLAGHHHRGDVAEKALEIIEKRRQKKRCNVRVTDGITLTRTEFCAA